MNKIKKQVKIAIFFGGKITNHLVLVRRAAKKLGVNLDLVSYNRVTFNTEERKVEIRGNKDKMIEKTDINDYDVLFFRTTGKHWEEVDLIINSIKGDQTVVVDPLVYSGKPSYACKAWQMLKLKEAGIDVPRSVYGSLWYLYEIMRQNTDSHQKLDSRRDFDSRQRNFASGESGSQAQCPQNLLTSNLIFQFPVIIKGSGGDRGTRVYKANNLEEMEKLVRALRKTETEEGKRYLLQEYIENDGDYRVIVLGEKVLGVMKRSSQSKDEFRNNYSAGGTVEVADLPNEVKELAVRAAKVCGLAVAGVDVAFRDFDKTKPVIWEVNKGPQFKGFMKATGINVPEEIIKYLIPLKK